MVLHCQEIRPIRGIQGLDSDHQLQRLMWPEMECRYVVRENCRVINSDGLGLSYVKSVGISTFDECLDGHGL